MPNLLYYTGFGICIQRAIADGLDVLLTKHLSMSLLLLFREKVTKSMR